MNFSFLRTALAAATLSLAVCASADAATITGRRRDFPLSDLRQMGAGI